MKQNSIYDITVKDNNGTDVTLAQYKGKVLLIVNTATACGLTPQYDALEALYEEYSGKGFEILDFPCNQFGAQAKGSDEEIHQFCTLNFGTQFPRFAKIEVNGPGESPLYTYLKKAVGKRSGKSNPMMKLVISLSSKLNGKSHNSSDIKWNFEKFLVDRQGNVVNRFDPTVTPEELGSSIQKLLEK